MHPITHVLASWSVATAADLDRKDRAMVTLAGAAADLDGLGVIFEAATINSETPLYFWTDYHHTLCHNITFGVLIAAVALAIGHRKAVAAALCLLTFHLHLLFDVIGARGPEGFQWPIPYFWPFSDDVLLSWSGQWELNAWPNLLFTVLLLGHMFWIAVKKGMSPLEIISARMDNAFTTTLKRRFQHV